MHAAFTPEEQEAILNTEVLNNSYQGNRMLNTSGGTNTKDKVFLLSYAETMKYFKLPGDRRCPPTEYAESHGAYTFANSDSRMKECRWLLRSPGEEQNRVSFCNVDIGECYVNDASAAVRPAMWVNLDFWNADMEPQPEEPTAGETAITVYGLTGTFDVTVSLDESGAVSVVALSSASTDMDAPFLKMVKDSESFLKQFIGKSGQIAESEIDMVTGATFSSKSVLNAVNETLKTHASE